MSERARINVYLREDGEVGNRYIVLAKLYKDVGYLRQKIAKHYGISADDIQLRLQPADSNVVRYLNNNENLKDLGEIASITACHSTPDEGAEDGSHIDVSDMTPHFLREKVRKLRRESHEIEKKLMNTLAQQREDYQKVIAEVRLEIEKERDAHAIEIEGIKNAHHDSLEEIRRTQLEEISKLDERHRIELSKYNPPASSSLPAPPTQSSTDYNESGEE